MRFRMDFVFLLFLVVTVAQAQDVKETTLAPEVEEATTITNVPEVEVVTEVAKKDAAEPLIIEKEMTTQPPVKEEVKVCHTELSGPGGLFTSENFPENYAASSNCTWNITVPEGQIVQLTFHLLNVEHNAQCVFDWVKVTDTNGTLLKQVCGFLSQDLVVKSHGNKITVQFLSDGVIESRGFLASWQALPGSAVDEGASPATLPEQAKSYVLTFPQSFALSDDAPAEKVCIQLSNVDADGEVVFSLLSTKSIVDGVPLVELKIPHKSGDADMHCYDVRLPSNSTDTFAVVRVQAEFPSIKYKILSYKSVQTLKSKPVLLIQTDKFDYRPKQEVKFRAMLLNSQMKPDAQSSIKSIWIEDPSDARLAQWKEVSLKKGMAQLSMPLGDEPTLGTWKIKAELETDGIVDVTFTVSESVLPKFQVTVEGPSTILRDTIEETFKVCAKYTHGSNVKGNANVTFISTYQDNSFWRAPVKMVRIVKDLNQLDQGCVDVKLNNTELGQLSEKTAEISATVVVSEAATGEQQNTTWKGQVSFLPFTIDFDSSSTDHIIGGFPFVGSLKTINHDGSPMPNIKIQVCARLFTDIESMRNYLVQNSHTFYSASEDEIYDLSQKMEKIRLTEKCSNYETKADGSFDFSIPLNADNIPKNISKLIVNAVAIDHPANETSKMKQPSQKLEVSLTHSNLTAALTVASVGQSKLKCGENSITAFYSAKIGDVLELSYIVSSGAAIVGNGLETVTVGETDLMSEFIGDSEVIKFDGDLSQDGAKRVLSKQIIRINRPLVDEARVSSKIKLLVYIKDTKGRTLSTTKEYATEACNTTVTAAWSATQLNPASKVSLKLTGPPSAFCGYNVVDKSVDLIHNPNKVSQPKLSELKEKLAESRIYSTSAGHESKCGNANLLFVAFEKMGLFLLSDSLQDNTACDTLIDITHLGGKRQEVDDHVDPPVAFAFAAAPQLSSIPPQLEAVQESFEIAEDQPAQANFLVADRVDGSGLRVTGGAGKLANTQSTIAKPKVELRNYFPETWLFDLIDLDEKGEANLDLETPHTITTWIADVVCSDLQTGLSVSNKAELLVSQDFFADLLLPYSVKRGEVFPLNISLFNTVNQKLPMKVMLKTSEDYTAESSESSLCLDAKDSKIETYRVTAKELNEVNITVEAAIHSEAVPECGAPGEADGYKDTLQKSIQVKPEGYPVEKVQSEFLCRAADQADTEETVTMENLKLPADLVQGSARAWISVTGDILAPALANLDSLVTLPTGCGEQNMITLVPNIYLLEYLNRTGKSEPKLEEKAQKYMKIGYNRQNDNYRHSDGSYSIWGPSKSNDHQSVGSMWLTTFVVKAFGQASKYIDIESREMQQSIDWILNKQSRKSGCFDAVGQFIHSSLAGPEQSLTASVLVALMEVEASKLDVVIDPAFIETGLRCIVENPTNVTDIYTRSLVTYALALQHELSETLAKSQKSKKGFQKREALEEEKPEPGLDTLKLSKEGLNSLLSQANNSMSGKIFWNSEDGSLSRSVEITAYNTLTLIIHDRLPEALQAIKWMTTNRNSQGGFVSTQDTMVAMQALSKYSVRVSKEDNDLKLSSVFGDSEQNNFALNEDNLLLVQKQKLETLSPEGENTINFKVKGKGCFMLQTVLRYNVWQSPDKTSFNMTAEQKGNALRLCASYVGDKKSTGMVVIEAELLSGYLPYELSLKALQNEVEDPTVKRYEINEKENKFVLYFNSMTKKFTCWNIELKREKDIGELKPAIVKIYDYYKREDVFSTEYNLEKPAEK